MGAVQTGGMMEKPKITGAEHNFEWEIQRADKRPDGQGSRHNYDVVIGAGDVHALGICTVWQQKPNTEAKANAQLIHAAPDMLDALIQAQQFIENGIELGYIRMPDEETGDSATETPKKIKQALKKAGVEL